jgi:flavin-binding protein dodecin
MSNSVYKIIEVVGTSKKSWEDAATNAIKAAGESVRDLRIAEITKLDTVIDKGEVVAFRARVSLSFKYDVDGNKKAKTKGK